MHGELFDIIFNFFLQLFFDSYWYDNLVDLGYDDYGSLFQILVDPYIRSYASGYFEGYLNGDNYLTRFFSAAEEIGNPLLYVSCHILTTIVIICLIVLLFRLFKWIFTLVFKLFRA